MKVQMAYALSAVFQDIGDNPESVFDAGGCGERWYFGKNIADNFRIGFINLICSVQMYFGDYQKMDGRLGLNIVKSK